MGLEIRDLIVVRGSFTLEIPQLVVEKGKIVLVQGPNGSGKTTLLKSIAGLVTPAKGVIRIGDEIVFKRYSKTEVNLPPEKRGVGYVPQDLLLFPHMTVYENIAYPLRARKLSKNEIKKRVEELLELVGLKGYENKKPHQLSGGEKQRVALARALATDPKILLLDEPFSSIDHESRNRLRDEIVKIIRSIGVTTLFVSHCIGDSVVADTVLFMRRGRIVASKTVANSFHNALPHTLFHSPTNTKNR